MTEAPRPCLLDQAPNKEPEHGDIVYSAGIIALTPDLSKVLVFIHERGTTLGQGVTGLPGGRNERDPETGDLESNETTALKEFFQETGRVIDNPDRFIRVEGNVFRARFPNPISGVIQLHEWDISRVLIGDIEDTMHRTHEGEARLVEVEELFNGYNGEIGPNVLNAIANVLDALGKEYYD